MEYKLSDSQWKRLQTNFEVPLVTTDQAKKFLAIRTKAKELAHEMMKLCPDARELSVALTAVEDSVMWAEEAIKRNEKKEGQT